MLLKIKKSDFFNYLLLQSNNVLSNTKYESIRNIYSDELHYYFDIEKEEKEKIILKLFALKLSGYHTCFTIVDKIDMEKIKIKNINI